MIESDFENKLRAVATQVFIQAGETDLAAIMIECRFDMVADDRSGDTLEVSVPPQFFNQVQAKDDAARDVLKQVTHGHVRDSRGDPDYAHVLFEIRLDDVSPDWEEVVKAQIAQAEATNQGLITETVFRRNGREPIMYGELKFGSTAEVRVAQELEQRKVLFFPLAVGVKALTGINHKDHREVDFMVIVDGVVGILEIQGPNHAGRHMTDVEKETWFQESGILCIKQFPSEQCKNQSGTVVDTFLNFLAAHKKR